VWLIDVDSGSRITRRAGHRARAANLVGADPKKVAAVTSRDAARKRKGATEGLGTVAWANLPSIRDDVTAKVDQFIKAYFAVSPAPSASRL
jgi:hypothetical protein